MARARLAHEIFGEESVTDVDLRKAANVVVTVFETDGTTLFAATIYNAASGGSSLVNGTDTRTNASGLLDLYTEPANARRVKVAITGVTALVNTAFVLDEGTLADRTTTQTFSGDKTFTGTTVVSGPTTLSGATAINGTTTVAPGVLHVPGLFYQGNRHHFDFREIYIPGAGVGGWAVAATGQGGLAPTFHYVGIGVTDAEADVSAFINAAIVLAKASLFCKKVYLPAAGIAQRVWGISQIDARDFHGGEIFGDGLAVTALGVLQAGAGQKVLDIAGSSSIVLRDFSIGAEACHPDYAPFAIVYYATNGIVSQSGNASRFERLSLSGISQHGTFCNGYASDSGASSSVMINCFLTTYGSGSAATGADAPPLRHRLCSNWGHFWVELHQIEAQFLDDMNPVIIIDNVPWFLYLDPGPRVAGNGFNTVRHWRYRSTTPGLLLDNCSDMLWDGGTLGGNGAGDPALFGPATLGELGGAPAVLISAGGRFVFRNVNIYAQDPVSDYNFGGGGYSGAPRQWTSIFQLNGGLLTDLTLLTCRLSVAESVFRGTDGAIWDHVFSRCHVSDPSATSMVDVVSGTMTFSNSDVDCNGLNVNLGAAGTYPDTMFRNVGTLTAAATPSGQWTDTSGQQHFNNGVSIGGIPATTGAIGIPKATGLYARNNANTDNIQMINTTTSNLVVVGDSINAVTTALDSATNGSLRIAGTNKVFYNATGVSFNAVAGAGTGVAAPNFTITNATADRLTLDQTSAGAAEVREALGTVIKCLIANGLFE